MSNFVNANFPTKAELISVINLYLQANSNILATEHNEIETALVNAIYGGQVGDIKEIACDNNYINANFDMTGATPGRGKSIGERYGWAICNGYNGTINKCGKVGVGYDPNDTDFSTLGNIGGEKKHTLLVTEIPPHGHKFGPLFRDSNLADNNMSPRGSNAPVGGYGTTNLTGGAGSGVYENTTGGSTVAHNNMQPYIVTLFIQRIAPY